MLKKINPSNLVWFLFEIYLWTWLNIMFIGDICLVSAFVWFILLEGLFLLLPSEWGAEMWCLVIFLFIYYVRSCLIWPQNLKIFLKMLINLSLYIYEYQMQFCFILSEQKKKGETDNIIFVRSLCRLKNVGHDYWFLINKIVATKNMVILFLYENWSVFLSW